MTKAGVLNLNKPAGITSFDVVRQVRKATGARRVGHAGTLDPLAGGVLLVCLGQATRIIPYLQDAPKVYLAGIKLGQRTDTYDREGRVVQEMPVPDTLDLAPFTGEVWQAPPAYSALKRAGRPLYDYARRGEAVETEPRKVRIDRIEMVSWEPPLAQLRVFCGKGTYIRSLANDLGGHLISLVREAVGSFTIEQALSMDRIAAWENELVSIPAALPGLARLPVTPQEAARLRNGLGVPDEAEEALAVDSNGQPVAVLQRGQPRIVFHGAA
jgi:tRNA pseudouridine55 synthase